MQTLTPKQSLTVVTPFRKGEEAIGKDKKIEKKAKGLGKRSKLTKKAKTKMKQHDFFSLKIRTLKRTNKKYKTMTSKPEERNNDGLST